MAIEIEVTCRECGDAFTPSHADYVRGIWRRCIACRDGPDSTPDPQIGGEARSGAANGLHEHDSEITITEGE